MSSTRKKSVMKRDATMEITITLGKGQEAVITRRTEFRVPIGELRTAIERARTKLDKPEAISPFNTRGVIR